MQQESKALLVIIALILSILLFLGSSIFSMLAFFHFSDLEGGEEPKNNGEISSRRRLCDQNSRGELQIVTNNLSLKIYLDPAKTFSSMIRIPAACCILITLFVIVLDFTISDRRSGKCLFIRSSSSTNLASKQEINEEPHDLPSVSHNTTLRDQIHGAGAHTPSRHTDLTMSSELTSNIEVSGCNDALPTDYELNQELYTYSPLLENEIRLLRIDRSRSQTGELQINLFHLPLLLAHSRGYVSLSYTWGDAETWTWIVVNNQPMKVRLNLVKILKRLSTFQFPLIWIDAICIDQSNLTECSAQVLRMRSIYAGAKDVIVATETGASIFADKIAQILAVVEPALSPENQASEVTNMLEDKSFQYALEILCNDDYWSRIWIVQEFAIGHDVKFLIKDSIIAVSKLELLLCILQNEPMNDRWYPAQVVYAIRKSWQTNKPIQLLQMLGYTQELLCKKRYDRVFGLLGLSLDALKYLFEPNYEMDLAIMTLGMTRSYIERISLNVIFLAPYCRIDSKQPSWSVDFFRFDQYSPDGRIFGMITSEDTDGQSIRRPTKWKATGSVTSNVHFRKNALLTSAFLIGTIRSLGSALSDEANSGFPAHDPVWSKVAGASSVCKWMYRAMLEQDYTYNNDKPEWNVYFGNGPPCGALGYSLVRVFLPSHNTQGAEIPVNCLVSWVGRNRKFFTGTHSLENIAKSLKHPFIKYGLSSLNYRYWGLDYKYHHWSWMMRMSKTNMRLMCLDDIHDFGIGWAATGARLHDKVFLIPGCSSPVILRQKEEGSYEVVGDAIIIGAMENEIWSKVKAEELEKIEIV